MTAARHGNCVRCGHLIAYTHNTDRWLPGARRHHGNDRCTGCTLHVPGALENRLGSRVEPADEVAVMRAARGERLPLNRDERRAAVWLCWDRGYSIAETARLTGMSSRSVSRLRLLRRAAA